jgi:DNA polymerase III epsilon subunit-like protein
MIFSKWDAEFMQQLGGGLPRDYCCIDVETTGLSPDNDAIVEIGHCLVRNGEPVDRLSIILDWSRYAPVSDDWFRAKLERLEQIFAKKGKTWHLTWDVVTRDGIDPIEALQFYNNFVRKLSEQRMVFVAHNGYRFDYPMIKKNMARYIGVENFDFGPGGLFDTGVVEKANQMEENPTVWPKPKELLSTYFMRVGSYRVAGVPWSLDDHCVPTYQLDRKYSLDMEKAHSAEFDAYLCHLLIEEWRLQGVTPAPPTKISVAKTVVEEPVAKKKKKIVEPVVPLAPTPDPAPAPPPSSGRHRRRGQRNR